MRKGFTLIELLLAAAFLVFTISAILMLFANCIFLNASNRALTVAASHAQRVMEEIRDANFSSIPSGDWDWDTTQIGTKGLNALTNESITTTITGTTLLNVVVTVSWEGHGQRIKSVSLETLFAEL